MTRVPHRAALPALVWTLELLGQEGRKEGKSVAAEAGGGPTIESREAESAGSRLPTLSSPPSRKLALKGAPGAAEKEIGLFPRQPFVRKELVSWPLALDLNYASRIGGSRPSRE